MTYTQIAILAVAAAVIIDLFVFRTRLVQRRAFWVSYAIIFFFQLRQRHVHWIRDRSIRRSGDHRIDVTDDEPPPSLVTGEWRSAVEDLLFGFSLILLSLSLWVLFGRRGIADTHRGPTDVAPKRGRVVPVCSMTCICAPINRADSRVRGVDPVHVTGSVSPASAHGSPPGR